MVGPAFEESAVRELCEDAETVAHKFFDSNGAKLTVMQHNSSGTLHARADTTHLGCGRLVSRSYSIVLQLKFQWPVCGQCRSKFPVVSHLKPLSKACPSKPRVDQSLSGALSDSVERGSTEEAGTVAVCEDIEENSIPKEQILQPRSKARS